MRNEVKPSQEVTFDGNLGEEQHRVDITFVISQSVCPKSNELLRSAEAGLRCADSGTRSDAGEVGAQSPKSMLAFSLTRL